MSSPDMLSLLPPNPGDGISEGDLLTRSATSVGDDVEAWWWESRKEVP